MKIRSNSTDFCKLVVRLAVLTAACANFAAAQTGAEAKVISMSGQVSVMKGSGQWALNAGDLIQPMQTIVTGPDGTAVLQVADRSKIDIYPNSQFVFRNNPGDFKDLVDLFLGKIKVKIEHFGGVPNNNKVRTPTAVIAVRGTIFDVEVDGRDETTVVQCEEGQVRVSHFDMPGGGSRDLGPGESVTVFKNQPLAKKSNVDRGAVAQKLVRMATDAASQILLNRSTGAGSTGSSSSSTTTSGDKAPPPPPTGGAPPTPAPGH